MGIQRSISFPSGTAPEWPAVAAKLAEVGESAALRIIDDLPAFPDETPEPGWRELRVGLAGGMVTLRRTATGFDCITWGNADPDLTKSWDRLCWAAAAAGGGIIADGSGERSADEFRAAVS